MWIPGAPPTHSVTSLTESGHGNITGTWQVGPRNDRHGRLMSGTGPRRPWLYDPSLGGPLVRAHRPPSAGAAGSVVSDTVWSEVLAVVRWAQATLGCRSDLVPGAAWRTASASAGLLRRLPGLCGELGIAWPGVPAPATDPERPGRERLAVAADRLAARLCSAEEVLDDPALLAAVAADVDEVGAASIALLAEGADWRSVR